MVKSDGVLHLIALYQGAKKPGDGLLSLDSGLMMSKLLVGGIRFALEGWGFLEIDEQDSDVYVA